MAIISLVGKDGSNIATITNGVPVFTGDIATPASVGAVRIVSEVDHGTYTGTALLRAPQTSIDGRLRVGIDTLLFNDNFNASAQNTSNWAYTFATLTAAQSGNGFLTFGAVQGTTSSHGANMKTFQYFPVIGNTPLVLDIVGGLATATLVANEVWMAGFGVVGTAPSTPTEGCWFKLTTAGLVGEAYFNGNPTTTSTLLALGSITVGTLQKWSIVVDQRVIEFWVEGQLLGTIPTPTGNGTPFEQAALPIFMAKQNTGNVSNTNVVRIASVTCTLMDTNSSKPWPHIMAGFGQMGYIGQNGGTMGKTQWWTNNTGPTAAAATNTTAISGATTLGGLVAVNPTLTANNDGILFDYTNPASTVNITGRNLIITGVHVHGAVSAALTGGPVLYAYAVAFGQTATSLATTETASFANNTTHAPRIVFLGMETYASGAAAGVLGGTGIHVNLTTPIVVRPGEHVALIARNMGTVTSAGAITVGCTFDSYWE